MLRIFFATVFGLFSCICPLIYFPAFSGWASLSLSHLCWISEPCFVPCRHLTVNVSHLCCVPLLSYGNSGIRSRTNLKLTSRGDLKWWSIPAWSICYALVHKCARPLTYSLGQYMMLFVVNLIDQRAPLPLNRSLNCGTTIFLLLAMCSSSLPMLGSVLLYFETASCHPTPASWLTHLWLLPRAQQPWVTMLGAQLLHLKETFSSALCLLFCLSVAARRSACTSCHQQNETLDSLVIISIV